MSNVNPISRADITLGKNLGSGGFGEVFEGTRRGGAPVAVKRLFGGMSEQSKTAFRFEVGMMRQLSSDFVVSVHGLVDYPPHEPMLLVMERMHEALSSAYGSEPAPLLRQRVEWLLQAGKGISFLHAQSPPILHRDIKPANMLLTSPATGRRLKMSDFGLSKSLADITASLVLRSTAPAAGGGKAAAAAVGTPHYMAPELMSMKPKYSPASDVYAFGVVCWETICMRLPYRACTDVQDIKAGVKAGDREDFELEDCPDFQFPLALKGMIKRAWAQVKPPSLQRLSFYVLWAQDPEDRPSIEQCVCELQWFLAQLDAEGAEAHKPSSAARPIAPLTSHLAPDSTLPDPARDSAVLSPPDSAIIAVQQLAFWTVDQVGFLVENAGPDFSAKGYGAAAVKHEMNGRFILDANDVELSTLFIQMKLDAVDMPRLRQAVSSWKADPAQALSRIKEETQRAAAATAAAEADRVRASKSETTTTTTTTSFSTTTTTTTSFSTTTTTSSSSSFSTTTTTTIIISIPHPLMPLHHPRLTATTVHRPQRLRLQKPCRPRSPLHAKHNSGSGGQVV
jgi:serine/threonine protein kinase